MRAFFVRWRSARQAKEYEIFAEEGLAAVLLEALEKGGGMEIWQSGTIWKCPGCGDRTVRTEEFVEGLRRAEAWLQNEEKWSRLNGSPAVPLRTDALEWMQAVAARLFGCERDRVYIKDEGGSCRFALETYISRV